MIECTECEYKGTDGCGPGPVMICLHPYFKDCEWYADAIISWVDGKAMSKKCPKLRKESLWK